MFRRIVAVAAVLTAADLAADALAAAILQKVTVTVAIAGCFQKGLANDPAGLDQSNSLEFGVPVVIASQQNKKDGHHDGCKIRQIGRLGV